MNRQARNPENRVRTRVERRKRMSGGIRDAASRAVLARRRRSAARCATCAEPGAAAVRRRHGHRLLPQSGGRQAVCRWACRACFRPCFCWCLRLRDWCSHSSCCCRLRSNKAAACLRAMPSEAERLKGVLESAARDCLGDRFPQAQEAVNGIAGITDALPSLAGTIAQSLWSHGMAAFNFLSLMLVTPLVVFYALLDWPKMLAKVDSWLPRSNADQIRCSRARSTAGSRPSFAARASSASCSPPTMRWRSARSGCATDFSSACSPAC